MRPTFAVIALAALLMPPVAVAHDAGGEATYLGNEGVLVSHGDVKVLFDAFYADSYNTYLLVPEDIQKALLAGRAPYDDIDALFVSHVHGDHFTAGPTLAFLRAHPEVHLYGPTEAVAALLAAARATGDTDEAVDALRARLTGFDLEPADEPERARLGSVAVEVVAVPHSGGDSMAHVRNLVFRVTLSDWPSVMHFGDATTEESDFSRHQAHWDAQPLDMAFPPYWFFAREEGRRILDERIRARQVIGIHTPAASLGKGPAWRNKLGRDLFTDPGESRPMVRVPAEATEAP